MANAFAKEANGIYTAELWKVDQSFTVYFDQGVIAKTDRGMTLFCNATSTSGLVIKKDEKWVEIPKESFPCKLALTFLSETKEKEPLNFTKALSRYVDALKLDKVSGSIDVNNSSPMISEYAAGTEVNLDHLRIKFFTLDPYVGEWTIGDAPKASGYGSKGYGSSAQKQSEVMADRIDYCIALEKVENGAKLTQAYLALNSLATELGDKMTFPDFLKLMLK